MQIQHQHFSLAEYRKKAFQGTVSHFSSNPSQPKNANISPTPKGSFKKLLTLLGGSVGGVLVLGYFLGIPHYQSRQERWILLNAGKNVQVLEPHRFPFQLIRLGTEISVYPTPKISYNTFHKMTVLSHDKQPLPFGYELKFAIQDPCKLEPFVSELRDSMKQIGSNWRVNEQYCDLVIQQVLKLYIEDKLSRMSLQDFHTQSKSQLAQDILENHTLKIPSKFSATLDNKASHILTLKQLLIDVLGITPIELRSSLNGDEEIKMVKQYYENELNTDTKLPLHTSKQVRRLTAAWESAQNKNP